MSESLIPVANEDGEMIHYPFDADFQSGLVSLALRDTAFMRRCSHLLFPSHFDDIGDAGAIQIATRHFKKYGSAIDIASLEMAVKDAIDQKVIGGTEKAQTIEKIKKAFTEAIPASAPLEEKLSQFAREQAVGSALLKSVEKLHNGDFEAIQKAMKKALDVGVNEEGDAYDYYAEIQNRSIERQDRLAGVTPPKGITTGYAKFDNLLYHRGWGRKEMSVLMAGAKQGKCLKIDSLIFTENGLAEIGDFIPADLGADEYREYKTKILGRNGLEYTSHVYNSGVTKTKRIKTKRFCLEIEGTPHHPMLVITPQGDLVWKKLEELEVGDYMAVQRGAGIYGSSTDLSKYQVAGVKRYELSNRKLSMNFPTLPSKMTPDLAEWLGMFVAEGYGIVSDGRITFTQKDKTIIDRFVFLTRKLFNLSGRVSIGRRTHDAFDVQFCNSMLVCYLQSLGVSFDGSKTVEIPHAIRCAPRECVVRFVGAVLGLEGCIRQNSPEKFTYDLTMASQKMIRQLQMLLLNEGITSHYSVKQSMATNGLRIKRDYYRLVINNCNSLIRLREVFGLYEYRKNAILDLVKPLNRTAQDPLPVEDLIKRVIDDVRNSGICISHVIGENEWKKFKTGVMCEGRRPSYFVVSRVLDALEQKGVASDSIEKLRELVSHNYAYDQVLSIEDGECQTVDFTVPGTHSFFANGLISHNTLAMINFAANASRVGFNVLYCTLEVSARIIAERLDAYISETAVKELDNRNHEVRTKIKSRGNSAGKFLIHEFASGSMSPRTLRTLIEKYRNRGTIFDLVVVDYADIMAPDHRSDSPIENSKEIYVGLRAIGFEFDCAILTATQTNRDGYKAQTAKAEHVAEDFNKIRTADLVISINATEDERNSNQARLYFAASRNQESGFTVRIAQDIRKMQFIKDVMGVE